MKIRLAFVILLMSSSIVAQEDGVSVQELVTDQDCSGVFVTHELDHVTSVPGGEVVRQFEANGGGVAINDLDNDGDLDIVLANHADPNTILWNEGDLTFEKQVMDIGDSRAVMIVDVDGDGWNDIVVSRRANPPNYFHNEGNRQFVLTTLVGVDKPLYAINWGDVDQDGDLDLVGATYDAGLLADLGQEFLVSGDSGLYVYSQDDGVFRAERLADEAQALALVLTDLNQDDRLDILVGNDFAVPDHIFVRTDDGWEASATFAQMTHSTMSYDIADINNDGVSEIFSTDMKPYAEDDETMAAWQPVMESMMNDPHPPNDPQVMENVLQIAAGEGFSNASASFGIDATGWSWSGKFGDLDQDGMLDLYVVNGFMEATTFAHLPNHELVEENRAFRNMNGSFELMPDWQLNSTLSGRGMSMADLDMDGDLDIVVNNLRGSAQLFENQLCGGQSLQVDLHWEGHPNTNGIGARIELVTSQDTLTRDVKVASGYLSGDASRVHFGFPLDVNLEMLRIHWSDGTVSVVDELEANTLITFTRSG